MLKPPILQRMLVGCWVLITINTLIFGFVIFLPQFFLRQGLTITNSLALHGRAGWRVAGWLRVRCIPVGCDRAALEHYPRRLVAHYCVRLDLRALQRRRPIRVIVLSVGAVLIVAIYIQTAMLFGVYTPELFPDRNTPARERYLQYARPWRHSGVAIRRRLPDGELRAARRALADDRPGRRADHRGLLLGRRAGETERWKGSIPS